MSDDQGSNGGNGSKVFDGMTIGELGKILLDEQGNVRGEILEEVREGNAKLGKRMDTLEVKIDGLETKVDGLRMEVHQNQTTFIKNHEELTKRVGLLEKKAA